MIFWYFGVWLSGSSSVALRLQIQSWKTSWRQVFHRFPLKRYCSLCFFYTGKVLWGRCIYIYIWYMYIYIFHNTYGCHCYVIVISFLLFCFYHWWSKSICWLTLSFSLRGKILRPKSKPQRTPTPQKPKEPHQHQHNSSPTPLGGLIPLPRHSQQPSWRWSFHPLFIYHVHHPKPTKPLLFPKQSQKYCKQKIHQNLKQTSIIFFFPKKTRPTTTAWKNTSSQV